MIQVELAARCVVVGDRLPILIECPEVLDYRQLQVEVFTVGVRNPSPALSFGTAPVILEGGAAQVEIDSQLLPVGTFEIRMVRLHDSLNQALPMQVDFFPGRDFERQLFKVVAIAEPQCSEAVLLDEIGKIEAGLEAEFLSPVDIRKLKTPGELDCCVFVFIRDMLIGRSIRFKNFELLPTSNGLESRDSLDFVNWFLSKHTTTGVRFTYERSLAEQSRNANPVCVVHFPSMIASCVEEVQNFCLEKVNKLLLALSLTRDAYGVVFEMVVFNRKAGSAVKISVYTPYLGNMCTGVLSGEVPETIDAYLHGLSIDPMNEFLVGLYREARREKNRNFQYIRFWQILETMAQNNNYDPGSPLLDFEGNAVVDEGQPKFCTGSVNIVYKLLRDAGVGSTEKNWGKINIWFAFRNAAAHCGSITRYSELSRVSVKRWAAVGCEKISTISGHDPLLWELKEDVKLLLKMRLARDPSAT